MSGGRRREWKKRVIRMNQMVEDQMPASENRQGTGDYALSWRESKNAFQCATDNSSEEENRETKEQGTTSSLTDALQEGGPAECSHQAVPDGGWGWVVMVATMVVLSLTLALPSSISIFFTDLQSEFNASNMQTSWVPAIMTATCNAGGPLCSILVERFGCRVTVMVGGLLSGLSMAATAMSRSITDIYITSGLTGLGCSLSFQPSVTIMGHYFKQRRVFANAMSSTGTAVGLCGLPLIANALLSQFGWRGSFLIMGGILLNCCVCGALMRPITSGPNKARDAQVLGKVNKQEQETKRPKDSVKAALCGFMACLQKHMAFDLFVSNVRYRVYTLGVTWFTLGYGVPLVYLVPYAKSHNVTVDRAAYLMSVLGLVNLVVRPTAALVMGLPLFRGSSRFVYVLAVAVLVNGLSNNICGVSAAFEALLAYVVIFGLSMSVTSSLLYTVLMDTVEMSRFPAALGLLSMMASVTLLIGPPLAGLLVDHTGQYSYVFFVCGACIFSSGLFLAIFFLFLDGKRIQEEKKKKKKSTQPDLYQKPAVNLAPDCQFVPSNRGTSEGTVHVTSV